MMVTPTMVPPSFALTRRQNGEPMSKPETQPPRVLILGRSQAVLADAVALLRQRGYAADASNRFDDVLPELDARHMDLVVFGGQVPGDTKAQLKRDISTLNDEVIFIDGLAGIPGLIARQVEGAFAARHRDLDDPPSYDADARTIRLRLEQPHAVTVTAWWQTSFIPPDPRSDSLVVLENRLSAGDHSIPLPEVVPDKAAFATVELDGAVYAFSVAAQP
jgi:hypothetical protein